MPEPERFVRDRRMVARSDLSNTHTIGEVESSESTFRINRAMERFARNCKRRCRLSGFHAWNSVSCPTPPANARGESSGKLSSSAIAIARFLECAKLPHYDASIEPLFREEERRTLDRELNANEPVERKSGRHIRHNDRLETQAPAESEILTIRLGGYDVYTGCHKSDNCGAASY
jgi:hypothetical protein